jgi:hypothetical protein
MSGLKKILERSALNNLDGGNASVKTINNLRDYRKRQFTIFVVVELLVVISVSACVYYITQSNLNSMTIKILTGILGIGSGGGLEVGRRIWKEWAQTDLLLALFSEATEAQIKTIIDKLIKKL